MGHQEDCWAGLAVGACARGLHVHGVCMVCAHMHLCCECVGYAVLRVWADGRWTLGLHRTCFRGPHQGFPFCGQWAISDQMISGVQPPKHPSQDNLGSCVVAVRVGALLLAGHCPAPSGAPNTRLQGQVVACTRGRGHTQWIGVCRPWPSRPPSRPRVPRTAKGVCVRGGSAGTV